ncbi:MAG: TrmH family RNA methyltransferase [Chitinivibrionales bacterium]|nr:TrmH family RNA methyltransferase [Chitinivibrionales bacterium]
MGQRRGDIETNYVIRSFDANISLDEYKRLPKNPLYIIVDNLRSAFNVGSIFRIADILRVKGLFLCGYTAFPPHIKLEKTSLGTIEYVHWKRFEHTLDAVTYLKKKNIPVWAAETTSISKKYTALEYPSELGIVFGNEALGIQRDVIDACDQAIEIPTYGFKNSLNVAAACAVIGFKFVEKTCK